MNPHFDTEQVQVWHGDCIDVMRELPDASVDAVVTDPPYGLEFMGKDWDAPWERGTNVNADAGFSDVAMSDGAKRLPRPSYTGSTNPVCINCGGKQRGRRDDTAIVRACKCDAPKFPNVRAIEMRAFQDWCFEWAAEALRVLKPGGHLLAFGGTRTFHRLTAGIEDAGFEIRDSIAWMYGSGFPKSLDVSKAIDKQLGAERAVIDTIPDRWAGKGSVLQSSTQDPGDTVNITAPATDAAKQWQGWGTALKPSHEPVVVARKPYPVLDLIAHHLDRLENEWQAQAPAPRTRTGAAAGSSAPTGTSPSESTATTGSNIVTSWRHCWAELSEATSTSTTATTTSRTTDLRTLSSSIASLTATNMLQPDATNRPGLTPLASAVDALFTSAVYASRATRALSAAETATEPTPRNSPAGAGNYQPIVVARKPLAGTVAANVLQYGTGALNIDATRTGVSDADRAAVQGREFIAENVTRTAYGKFEHDGKRRSIDYAPGGRWPANVVLDTHTAALLDQQSGVQRDGVAVNRNTDPAARKPSTVYGAYLNGSREDQGYGGMGGASRFFYTAKADSFERPNVDGVSHPTVKPLDLMQWLVRLVTPKGGTVLEPFAGSGTTVEACLREGFRCIAIEREADYLPLIMHRVSKPHAVGLDFGDWEDAS